MFQFLRNESFPKVERCHFQHAIQKVECYVYKNVKVIPQQAEVAQGVPGRLRSWIFLTFGTTRMVGRQPYAPAAFTPGEIHGTHFQSLSRPQGTWVCREPRKKSPVTPPGIDPRTSRLVVQCLNHYATSAPVSKRYYHKLTLKFFSRSVFMSVLEHLTFHPSTTG